MEYVNLVVWSRQKEVGNACDTDMSLKCDTDMSLKCDTDMSLKCDTDMSLKCDTDMSLKCDTENCHVSRKCDTDMCYWRIIFTDTTMQYVSLVLLVSQKEVTMNL